MEITPKQTVADIGERALINCLTPFLVSGTWASGFGVGDDCAILHSAEPGSSSVYTTDLLIQGTHFIQSPDTDWSLIGHKAAAANLSDLAAMGARPGAMLVSLGLPPDFLVEDVLSFYRGFHALATTCGAPIIGGDTTRSDNVVISITAIGSKAINAATCLRSDATPGDYLYVSGALGASRAGLQLILHPQQRDLFPPFQAQALIARHYQATPQVTLGLALAKLYPRVAIIDISDGLYNEANLLAEASAAGLEIQLPSIPIEPSAQAYLSAMGIENPHDFALFSGEEYQLLFALPVPPDVLKADLARYNVAHTVSHIGTVTSGAGVQFLHGTQPIVPRDKTFAHFSRK